MDTELTGRTAELMLRAAMGDPMTTAIYEGLCAGNSQSPVRGIAVCYAPTVDVLRRAAAERKNLILSREHPFFLHGGLNYAYTSGGLEAALKDDPDTQATRELIAANQQMLLRFGEDWYQFDPKNTSLNPARPLSPTPRLPSPAHRSPRVAR